MTNERRFQDAVGDWMNSGSDATPPAVIDAVLLAVKSTPQERDLRQLWHASSATYLRAAAVLAIVAAAGLAAYALGIGPNVGTDRPAPVETVPEDDPRSAFIGTWISTTDADGGTQTMTIQALEDGGVSIAVTDDIATVCSGTPSTMLGTGRVEGATALVIPAPVYTCNDGREPETLTGAPLDEILQNLTFELVAAPITMADNLGGLWVREGAEMPSGPGIGGSLWPQSSLEEVRQAQEAADAGELEYAWQLDPRLLSDGWWDYLRQPGAEIVERFVHDALGWDGYLFNPYLGDDGDGAPGGIRGVVILRCGPDGMNPLYPTVPDGHQAAPGSERCAPTIDELRYETVRLDLLQPAEQGPTGLWVVSGWTTVAPFGQVDPAVAQGEATAELEAFLEARLDGEGAEGRVAVGPAGGNLALDEVPLLYATSSGSPFERYEIELVDGPLWPRADMRFDVRLFADGGETIVEQAIDWYTADEGGLRLHHEPTETTENGASLALPYRFVDGTVTMSAAAPWVNTWRFNEGLAFGEDIDARLFLMTDPLPAGTGCEPGPAAADAEGLADAIQSDPDLQATAPVPVTIGGLPGLQMDVVAAPGASVCEDWPAVMVLQIADGRSDAFLAEGYRLRLYLLDLPGGSAGTLAIAVAAPEERFDQVLASAQPIIVSVEFRVP